MINLKSLEPFLVEKKSLEDKLLKLSVDNRQLNKDTIFIAIVGERYNPLEHLSQLIPTGCQYVLYEKNESNDLLIEDFKTHFKFLSVANLFETIGKIGEVVASEFKSRNGKLIAISGSNGKTTTKEMLNHIIAKSFGDKSVICTQKNNNNHLGVPFTLFQIGLETQFGIIELGSNAPGEIEYLCKMIKPNIGVTTNIGDTHLEFFGDQAAVFKEEGILSQYCEEMFFVNADDTFLSSIKSDSKNVSFGLQGVNYRFRFLDDGIEVNDYHLINKEITGKHNFQNLALAFSIAHYLNPNLATQYRDAAKSFRPTPNRSQWIDLLGTPVFLDAYNANPSSMKVALDGFSDYLDKNGASQKEACVILGDMNELGENSDSLHAEIGKYVLSKHFGAVVFVGRFRDDYTQEVANNIFKFPDTESAAQFIKERINGFKYLFIKGSRSLQLERITDIK